MHPSHCHRSPEIKIKAVKELGATVQLVGDSFYEAQVIAQVCAGVGGGRVGGWGVGGGAAEGAGCRMQGEGAGRCVRGSCVPWVGRWVGRRVEGSCDETLRALDAECPCAVLESTVLATSVSALRLPSPPTTTHTHSACLPQERAAQEGRAYVSAYDDPYTIAGQGTIGLEVLRQTDMDNDLDAIFVPIGVYMWR